MVDVLIRKVKKEEMREREGKDSMWLEKRGGGRERERWEGHKSVVLPHPLVHGVGLSVTSHPVH